ncbi:glycosyltransferase family 4 protein [Roseicella aquatilis]|uniref:Glycosyltransferase n=1 Tax=Roseicella aquatilis TaxID=2527868 RepID=A0A4R4DU15_9PROT|nr:glycosyltransferase family 4 protein [Roseicella aquatilis]TCZ65508.1 glycosyltransferase [Roseicella aquatilis]
MRTALLVPAPFETVSGGYIYDRRIVEGLRRLGHEVEVVELAGRHPLPDAAAEAAARAALAALPAEVRPVIDGLGLPAFAGLVEELVAHRAVALIHHPTALEHGAPQEDREALRGIERDLFPRLARIIATSPHTAQRLVAEFEVPAGHIGVVEPGTDPAPRAQGSDGPGVAILSVGTLVPRKGHDVLMRALAGLPDLDWTLTIAGDEARNTAHAHGLRALAEKLGIAQRVTFAGELEAEALEALYRRADLFALATWWEGYGMAAAEALARGLPLAITAGGAIADLVPVEAGAVSPPGDVVSLTKALRRMIFDAEMRREMAEAAWQAGQRLPRWEDRAAAFAAELERA